jgi:hypothetical protein
MRSGWQTRAISSTQATKALFVVLQVPSFDFDINVSFSFVFNSGRQAGAEGKKLTIEKGRSSGLCGYFSSCVHDRMLQQVEVAVSGG